MQAIHFIGGEKGGVGKSVVARLLSQYFVDVGKAHVAFDADQSHPTLTRYYKEFTSPINLDLFESTDAIMEQALEGNAQVLVDLPAQSQRFLHRWIDEGGVVDLCQESGLGLYYWYVVDDGLDSANLLQAFLENYGAVMHCVVLRNHGCGSDFGDVDQVLANCRDGDMKVSQIDLPSLHTETMRKIDKCYLSFWAAVNAKEKGERHLSIMERQRTKMWLKKSFALFAQVLASQSEASDTE